MRRLGLVLVGAVLIAAIPEEMGTAFAVLFVFGVTVAGLRLAFGPFPSTAPKGETEPEEWDDGEWKPCRNPQCRAPILRSARRSYCSQGCKDAVRRLRLRDAGDTLDPADGDIPF